MAKKRKGFLKSTRRIGVALLTIGILAQSIATGFLVVRSCGEEGTGCLASAVVFGFPEFNTEVPTTLSSHTALATTPGAAINEPSVLEGYFAMVQVTGLYLILVAVLMLVALESVELHYLRKIIKKRKLAW